MKKGTKLYQFIKSVTAGPLGSHLAHFFKQVEIPWWSYPAVEFCDSLDARKLRIFEYGCGSSTIYWNKRGVACYTGVEDDYRWLRAVSETLIDGKVLEFAPHLQIRKTNYVLSHQRNFKEANVVAIDGSHRYQCAKRVVAQMSNQLAIVVLDDANWFPRSAELLRTHCEVEIPLIGHSAGVYYKKVTTVFIMNGKRLKGLRDVEHRVLDSVEENFETHISTKLGNTQHGV